MMTETLGYFSKSALLIAAFYLGVSWILGNTFSGRLAEWKHVPACVSGLKAREAAARHGLPSERDFAKTIVGGLLQAYPELRSVPLVGQIEHSLNRPETLPQGSGWLAICRCLASLARKESRTDFMFWVATVKIYEPEGVANFQGIMSRLDHQNICGKGV